MTRVNVFQISNYHVHVWQSFRKTNGLTNAPSRLKIADAPTMLAGAIFLLQRLRRNVSEDRSFLWNFQPIRDEYSQPSPKSFFCWEIVLKSVIILYITQTVIKQSEEILNCCTGQRWSYLESGCVCYFLARSNQSFSAMDVVHFLRSNPRPRFIIRRYSDAIFPA